MVPAGFHGFPRWLSIWVFFLKKLLFSPAPWSGTSLGAWPQSHGWGLSWVTEGWGWGQSPAVGEEAPIGVTRAVAARGGAGRPLILQGLPGERRAIEGTLFLPPSCQWAARRASVRGVLATDVTKPHTAWNRALCAADVLSRRTQRKSRHRMSLLFSIAPFPNIRRTVMRSIISGGTIVGSSLS